MIKQLINLIIFSKKHINNFDKNNSITTKNCIKKKFIDIIFNFHIIDKDVFYKDLYFKDKVKSLILKNLKKTKIIRYLFINIIKV